MPDDGYDKPNHPDPPWEWIPRRQKHPDQGDDGGVDGNHWKLRDSADPGYNCTTYTVDKVQGKAPDGTFIETTDAIARLNALGYQEMDGARCGCEEGKLRNCTVVYRDKQAPKAVFHAAVFDPRLCDWGGKLTGSEPIIRFRKPEDYLMRYEKAEREKSEMVFYCKEGESPYITDQDLAKNANKPKGGICLFVLVGLIALMSYGVQAAWAKVGAMPLGDLIKYCDIVAIAKVDNITRADGLAIARAQVERTLKGNPNRSSLRFVASPTWTCDSSKAEPGERVLLFLGRQKSTRIRRDMLGEPPARVSIRPLFRIAHSGRGRMELSADEYVHVSGDVILPKSVPRSNDDEHRGRVRLSDLVRAIELRVARLAR